MTDREPDHPNVEVVVNGNIQSEAGYRLCNVVITFEGILFV